MFAMLTRCPDASSLQNRVLATEALPPNALRFCCQALRRPPPSWLSSISGGGRSGLGLVSSKRGLDGSAGSGALVKQSP
jgi:hypothetical protein